MVRFAGLKLSERAKKTIEQRLREKPFSSGLPLGEKMQQLYELACLRFPTLKQVRLVQDVAQMPQHVQDEFQKYPTTAAFAEHPDTIDPHYYVFFNPGYNTEVHKQVMDAAPKYVEITSKQLGITAQEMYENPEIDIFLILLHELGHNWHDIKRYKHKNLSPGEIGDRIDTAIESEWKLLPLPGYSPSQLDTIYAEAKQLLDQEIADNKKRYAALGIYTSEQLLEKQEEAYRHMPAEKEADNFSLYAFALLREYLFS